MIWAISALLVGGLLVLAGFVLLTLVIRRINRTFEDLELEPSRGNDRPQRRRADPPAAADRAPP